MNLYYAPTTVAVAVAITLHEAGLEFTLVPVDLAAAEQTAPDYQRVNPKGRVPALQTDQGMITETGALLEYVAALAPDAGLVPTDPISAARMREVMYYLASTMHINHAHGLRGHRWADNQSSWDDMKTKVPETMTASCAHIEHHALQGPYVLGDTICLADPYLYVISTWLENDGVDLSQFPKLTTFMRAMSARDSVRAVTQQGLL